jgi:hypothetical protein
LQLMIEGVQEDTHGPVMQICPDGQLLDEEDELDPLPEEELLDDPPPELLEDDDELLEPDDELLLDEELDEEELDDEELDDEELDDEELDDEELLLDDVELLEEEQLHGGILEAEHWSGVAQLNVAVPSYPAIYIPSSSSVKLLSIVTLFPLLLLLPPQRTCAMSACDP